jgi:hypothetical protein
LQQNNYLTYLPPSVDQILFQYHHTLKFFCHRLMAYQLLYLLNAI